jgi:anaerobic magnesium-protoporphyrin IX monomethyl ester cyclase
MRLVFLQKDSMVKIAVMLLSAVLKEDGHECALVMESIERQPVDVLLAMEPDVVAFSCTSGQEPWVRERARQIKERSDIPVIVGGPAVTFFPEIIGDEAIDVVCRGEGEQPLREYARALDAGVDPSGIANLWVKRDGEIVRNDMRPLNPDLDTLPAPDWSVYADRYAFLVPYYQGYFPAMTSRGCPHACSYCANDSYIRLFRGMGKYVRRESPEHAVARLVDAKRDLHLRRLNFVDDSMAADIGWLREFSAGYRERVGLPCMVNVRADTITEEAARLLADMRCRCARMGLESGNSRVRQEVLNKRVSDDQLRAAARALRGAGMRLVTYNMYGSPTETIDEAFQTYLLNRELKVDYAQCALLQPYPGTKVRDLAESLGLLQEEGDVSGQTADSFFVASPIKLENKSEIVNLQKLTQSFIRLHVPPRLARAMLRLPENGLFHLIFTAEYALWRLRLDWRETIPFLRMAIRSRTYMARRPVAAKRA